MKSIPEGYQDIHDLYSELSTEHLRLVKREVFEALRDMALKYNIAIELLEERHGASNFSV